MAPPDELSEPDFAALVGDAFRASTDLLVVLDPSLNVRFASEGTRHILGFEPADVIGRPGLDLVAAEDAPRVSGMVTRIGDGFSVRVAAWVRLVHADGRYVPSEINGGGFLVDGELAGYWVVARLPVRAEVFANVLHRVLAEEPLSQALGEITALLPDVGERVCVTCWASSEPAFTVGHRLPRRINGSDVRAGSPWDRALSTGTSVSVGLEELDADLARLARREGFAGVFVSPIVDAQGATSAFLTLWSPPGLWGPDAGSAVLGVRELVEGAIVIRLQLEQLRRTARSDPLTGLANRVAFHDSLRVEADVDAMSVLYIDLDDFKDVNDTYGHAAGDELLQAAARRLEASVRSTDLVARLGGDEFAVLCRGLSGPGAVALASRILDNLRQPLEVDGVELRVQASIGVASAPRCDSGLLEQADGALYEAKRAGRNVVRVAG